MRFLLLFFLLSSQAQFPLVEYRAVQKNMMRIILDRNTDLTTWNHGCQAFINLMNVLETQSLLYPNELNTLEILSKQFYECGAEAFNPYYGYKALKFMQRIAIRNQVDRITIDYIIETNLTAQLVRDIVEDPMYQLLEWHEFLSEYEYLKERWCALHLALPEDEKIKALGAEIEECLTNLSKTVGDADQSKIDIPCLEFIGKLEELSRLLLNHSKLN